MDRAELREGRHSTGIIEGITDKYLEFVDMVYDVAFRFTGERLAAERLTVRALNAAMAAELKGVKPGWVKRHLLKHVRESFVEDFMPERCPGPPGQRCKCG